MPRNVSLNFVRIDVFIMRTAMFAISLSSLLTLCGYYLCYQVDQVGHQSGNFSVSMVCMLVKYSQSCKMDHQS